MAAEAKEKFEEALLKFQESSTALEQLAQAKEGVEQGENPRSRDCVVKALNSLSILVNNAMKKESLRPREEQSSRPKC